MASTNDVKIAGVKLRWQRVNKDTEVLINKEHEVVYTIKKLRDGVGVLQKDELNRPQYQAYIGETDEELDPPEPYLPSAKGVVHSHFGKTHGGAFEGHWTVW